MKKPSDVRLLLQDFIAMMHDENEEPAAQRLHCLGAAVLSWVLEEPERMCQCHNSECGLVEEIKSLHAEWDDWLAADRGAMN